MKKFTALVVLLCCCLCLNGFVCVAPYSSTPAEPDINEIKAARFENMLNINTVYGEDFLDNQKLVNAAAIVLKNYADDDGFIENGIVTAYIKDMYDIDIDINCNINKNFPQKEGYTLIIPRGYSVYEHTVTSVQTHNGYIFVTSNVTVKTHDGYIYETTAETKFIENANGTFGYSIIDSVLLNQNSVRSI